MSRSVNPNGKIVYLFQQMNSPMKKIGINGNAQTYSPYQLSLSNKYDAKHPLNTLFSFDTTKRSADFQMNYDLGMYCIHSTFCCSFLYKSVIVQSSFCIKL